MFNAALVRLWALNCATTFWIIQRVYQDPFLDEVAAFFQRQDVRDKMADFFREHGLLVSLRPRNQRALCEDLLELYT